MLTNPQDLIAINGASLGQEGLGKVPDAIYIPYFSRYSYLQQVLESLAWYKGNIYILPTRGENIILDSQTNVTLLYSQNHPFSSEILGLRTFQQPSLYTSGWDLPFKRNFALLHSVRMGFKYILLVDDDIEGITPTILNKGINALGDYTISGCLGEGSPDTSTIGHIEQTNGEVYYPFLSGNFLFIKPSDVNGYFPLIYNEDWLFMIPAIQERKIVAVDVVRQRFTEQFDSVERVRFQEFGEIIAEGLFELIHSSRFEERMSKGFWGEYIQYRRSYVQELLNIDHGRFRNLVRASLDVSEKITARQCVSFIEMWEKDLITFANLKKK